MHVARSGLATLPAQRERGSRGMMLPQAGEAPPRKASVAERGGASGRSLDIDYARYRRLLTAALARLARNGYAVPPDEGLDLIHDFFVEAWEGLIHRFDADKASFETYIYGAFIRFARPRIVRLNRLRSGL